MSHANDMIKVKIRATELFKGYEPGTPYRGQVQTPFDDPDHHYGQWTGELTIGAGDVGDLSLLIPEAHYKIKEDMKLKLYIGSICLAEMTVMRAAKDNE